MNKAYLITPALAISLGINGILIANTTAKATSTMNNCGAINHELAAGAKTTLESWLASNLADAANELFGEGVATMADLRAAGIDISWGTKIVGADEDGEGGTPVETATVSTRICKPGTWTPGEPE